MTALKRIRTKTTTTLFKEVVKFKEVKEKREEKRREEEEEEREWIEVDKRKRNAPKQPKTPGNIVLKLTRIITIKL